MTEVKWIKLSTDLFDNRKIRHIRMQKDGNNILIIWIFLLTLAGRCNAGGMIYLTETIPYTAKMLADECGFKPGTIKAALEVLQSLDMITLDPLAIVDWESHQNVEAIERIREQNRARQEKFKYNKKTGSDDTISVTSNVTNNASVTKNDVINSVTSNAHITKSNVTSNVTNNASVTLGNAIEEEEKEEDIDSLSSSFLPNKLGLIKGTERTFLGGALGRGLVFISQDQIDDLLNRLSVDEFDHYVSVIADCEEKGKHFSKSHYQAILDMAERDRKKR